MAANSFGLTLRDLILQKREEALMALKGYEFFGEHEDGEPVWALMPEDHRLTEQMRIVGAAIDELGYHLREANCSARAMEEMLDAHGINVVDNFREFHALYERFRAADAAKWRGDGTDPADAAGEEAANGAD